MIVALVIAVLLVRAILARPTIWFVLLGIALPIRIPVSLGTQEGNLLVPLYAVMLLGLAAWVWGRARGRIDRPAPEGPGCSPRRSPPSSPSPGLTALERRHLEAPTKAVFFYLPFIAPLRPDGRVVGTRARALAALAITTVAGGVIAARVGLYQYATRATSGGTRRLQQANVYSRFFRVNGIFFDPNILGRYLAIGIMIRLALAWVRRAPAGAVAARRWRRR